MHEFQKEYKQDLEFQQEFKQEFQQARVLTGVQAGVQAGVLARGTKNRAVRVHCWDSLQGMPISSLQPPFATIGERRRQNEKKR